MCHRMSHLASHLASHRMFHRNVPFKCSIEMFHSNVPPKCSIQMFHRNVPFECSMEQLASAGHLYYDGVLRVDVVVHFGESDVPPPDEWYACSTSALHRLYIGYTSALHPLYIGSTSASPTPCPVHGHRHAKTRVDGLDRELWQWRVSYVYTHVYTHVSLHACTHVGTHVGIHVYTHAYTLTNGLPGANTHSQPRRR